MFGSVTTRNAFTVPPLRDTGIPLLIAVQVSPPSLLLNTPCGFTAAYSVLLSLGSTASASTDPFATTLDNCDQVSPPSIERHTSLACVAYTVCEFSGSMATFVGADSPGGNSLLTAVVFPLIRVSVEPPGVTCAAPFTGKSLEVVFPMMYRLPRPSVAAAVT